MGLGLKIAISSIGILPENRHSGRNDGVLAKMRIASSGQFLVAIIGFRLVYKQIRHLNLLLRNDAQGRLYTQNAEVRTLIANYPEIKKYFFENCVIDHNDENYPRVTAFLLSHVTC